MSLAKRVNPIDPPKKGPKAGVSYAPRGKKKVMKFQADPELAELIEREAEAYGKSVSVYLSEAMRTFIRERCQIKSYRLG